MVFSSLEIPTAVQVCNLYETWFTLWPDYIGKRNRVVADNPVNYFEVLLLAKFQLQPKINCAEICYRRWQENFVEIASKEDPYLRILDDESVRNLKIVVSCCYKAYWRRDTASSENAIFKIFDEGFHPAHPC